MGAMQALPAGEGAATAMPYDVAYADTDAGGIVYHARYVEMAERSRNRAMAALGVPVQDMLQRFGMQFVIREVRLVCHAPAFVGDALRLASGITTVSAVRVNWRTRVSREGCPVCDVEAQVVAFDPATRGPTLLPGDLMALLGCCPRLPPLRRAPMMKAAG